MARDTRPHRRNVRHAGVAAVISSVSDAVIDEANARQSRPRYVLYPIKAVDQQIPSACLPFKIPPSSLTNLVIAGEVISKSST